MALMSSPNAAADFSEAESGPHGPLQTAVGKGEGREGLPPLQSFFALSLRFLLYKASDVLLLKAPTTPHTSIPVWPRWL